MAKEKTSDPEKNVYYPEKLGTHGGMIRVNAVGKVWKDGKVAIKLLKNISVRNTGDYRENLTKARVRFGKELEGADLRAWHRYGDYMEIADPSAKGA
jgi:hypothetical protein